MTDTGWEALKYIGTLALFGFALMWTASSLDATELKAFLTAVFGLLIGKTGTSKVEKWMGKKPSKEIYERLAQLEYALNTTREEISRGKATMKSDSFRLLEQLSKGE